jgi:hypothetical protein
MRREIEKSTTTCVEMVKLVRSEVSNQVTELDTLVKQTKEALSDEMA